MLFSLAYEILGYLAESFYSANEPGIAAAIDDARAAILARQLAE